MRVQTQCSAPLVGLTELYLFSEQKSQTYVWGNHFSHFKSFTNHKSHAKKEMSINTQLFYSFYN